MLVNRLDTGVIKNYQRTPEGFLNVYLTVSRIGDLVYQRSDGSLESEYLSEQELFSETSLATLVGKPITLDHPPEPLSSLNVTKFIKGALSHKVIKDTPFLTILGTIHDAETIEAVESGKARQVSAGYRAKAVRGDDGRIYQQQREYNHVSVVPLGRAGSDVRVHFDSKTNQFENMGIQVMTHTDEMISLIAVEVGARNSYIQRLANPAKNDSGQELKRAIAASNENHSRQQKAASEPQDDGRKEYIARLKNPKGR